MQLKLKSLLLCVLLTAMFKMSNSQTFTQTTTKITLSSATICFDNITNGSYPFSFTYISPGSGQPARYPTTGTVTANVARSGANLTISVPSSSPLPDLTISKGIFTLGGYNLPYEFFQTQCTPLPVKLSSFTAALAPGAPGFVKLTWVTTQESNSSHFIIQKTTSGVDWVDHGVEPASVNSSLPVTYTFMTTSPATNVQYFYRLKMVDLDGRYTYSTAKSVYGYPQDPYPATSFCEYTRMIRKSADCDNSQVFSLRNAPAGVAWSVGSGAVAADRGGTLITVAGCRTVPTILKSNNQCLPSVTLAACANILTINAPVSFCTSATVNLLNVPSGAAVEWSANPANIIQFGATNSPSTTITKLSNGSVVIAARLLNSCMSPVFKTVVAGAAAPGITINGIAPSPNTQMDVTAVTTAPAPYLWYVDNVLVKTAYSTSTTINGGNCGYHNLTLSVTSSCGTSAASTGYNKPCGGYSYFMASPNPASSQITISHDELSPSRTGAVSADKYVGETASITAVEIYDQQGTLKKRQTFAKLSNVNLNVADLKVGIYTLIIYNGTYREEKKIQIIK